MTSGGQAMGEKRYKSAYFMRKQEKEDLKEEVRRLQHKLAQLNPVPSVEQVALENTVMLSIIHQQQIDIACVQSAISPLLNWGDRGKTLRSLRDNKFKAVYEYIKARSQMATPQLSDERFETANGDTCCSIFQTIHLEGVKSLQQVYDALLFSINNAEISISERLGHVTVRDDYEDVDGNISNARIVSTNDDGITTELNCIMMSQMFDVTDDFCGKDRCGMVVIDSVGEDDLHPYLPNERVRKDVSAAFMLSTERSGADEEKLVVILRRAAFVKIHRPVFEISEAVWQEVQQDAALWGDVVIRSIRSLVYTMA